MDKTRASARTAKIHEDLTGPAAFVMDWEELHCKVDDKEVLEVHGVDAEALARHYAHCVLSQVFELGFFNADPHPGNVAVCAGTRLPFGLCTTAATATPSPAPAHGISTSRPRRRRDPPTDDPRPGPRRRQDPPLRRWRSASIRAPARRG